VLGYDITHSTALFDYLGTGTSGEDHLPTDVLLFKRGTAPRFRGESSFKSDPRAEGEDEEGTAEGNEEDDDEEELPQLGDLIQTAQVQSLYEKKEGREGEDHNDGEEEERHEEVGTEVVCSGDGEEETLQLQSETVSETL
jgi:hypothetical protein